MLYAVASAQHFNSSAAHFVSFVLHALFHHVGGLSLEYLVSATLVHTVISNLQRVTEGCFFHLTSINTPPQEIRS